MAASSPTESAASLALSEAPVEDYNGPPHRPHTINATPGVNEHYHIPTPKGNLFARRLRRANTSTLQPYAGWEQPTRRPYHEYVHSLVLAGWTKLKGLDTYMGTDVEDRDLTISVVDVDPSWQLRRWPDIHDRDVLESFIQEEPRGEAKVRIYVAEQTGDLAAGVMEVLGAGLNLDPRFFQWSVTKLRHGQPPSLYHKAQYVNIGFGVPNLRTASKTDAEKFTVSVCVKPDEVGDGWTGIFLFGTHTRVGLSARNITVPPAFSDARPPPDPPCAKSFRSLFLESLEYLSLPDVQASPFYAISHLLRLNYVCWSEVITSIRNEDRRINGISDTTIGHAEQIRSSLALVRRGGSYGWRGGDVAAAVQARQSLEEDFRHLVEQTELLWQNRDKMAAIRQRKSERRWTSLTNTFTYVFAPVTIVSGVYGMNVSEISGTNENPDIWQAFVAVVALNLLVVAVLALSNWIHIARTHSRWAGAREVFGFAIGKVH